MLFHALLGLSMLMPGIAPATKTLGPVNPPPAVFITAANDHVKAMRFHGHDKVTVLNSLGGPDTGLDLNTAMAFAPDGSLWTANIGILGHPPALEHFAKGAHGDSAPLARITCGLSETTGVAVDKAGNVYALNRGSQSVNEFAPTQNGCATPIASIRGNNTQFSEGMLAINIDDQGRIYVGSFQNAEVVVFAPGSNGNVSPIGVLRRGVSGVSSIAFDAQQNVYVANIDLGSVAVYAPGQFGPNVTPIRLINGGLGARPGSIAITPDQRLFTLNFVVGIHELFEYPAGANGNIQPEAIFDSVVNPPFQDVNTIINPARR